MKNFKNFAFVIACGLVACNNNSPKSDTTNTTTTTVVKVDSPKTETPKVVENTDSIYVENQLVQIRDKKISVAFTGTGTEPFWTVYILEKEVLVITPESNAHYPLLNSFNPKTKTQTIRFDKGKGEEGTIKIVKEPGTDGMSDEKYPYTVHFYNVGGGGLGLYEGKSN